MYSVWTVVCRDGVMYVDVVVSMRWYFYSSTGVLRATIPYYLLIVLIVYNYVIAKNANKQPGMTMKGAMVT